MGVAAAESQVDKKPYKNQTAGWLGVVKLDHLGGQIGHSVEPYGTVFLSDDEALLTARAPKSPKDNPFTEKEYLFVDEKGNQVTQAIRRLVLIEDERELPDPNERFVPGLSQEPPQHTIHGPSMVAGQTDTATALESDDDREVPTTPQEGVLADPRTAAVPPSHHKPNRDPFAAEGADQPESWADPAPDWSPNPQPGALAGGDAAEETASTGVQDADPDGSSDEETAAETSTGEETGAAATPEGQAPEGEYASTEEVGSPDAPQQGES